MDGNYRRSIRKAASCLAAAKPITTRVRRHFTCEAFIDNMLKYVSHCWGNTSALFRLCGARESSLPPHTFWGRGVDVPLLASPSRHSDMESNLKSHGKRWTKKAVVRSGLLRHVARCRRPAGIILMYHSVLDDPKEGADSIGVDSIHSTDIFRKEMEFIARHYTPVSMEDIRLFLNGQKPMPQNPVAVTFDDGYADNFEVAARVLNDVGMPGTFYLTVESVETGRLPWFCHLRHAFATTTKKTWQDPAGRSWDLRDQGHWTQAFFAGLEHVTQLVGDAQQEALRTIEHDLEAAPLITSKVGMMTWEHARGLCRHGHVVGSHGLTHPNMAYIADHDLQNELSESKRKLETELGLPAVHFSYPAAGLTVSWTERTVTATKGAGYQTAVTTSPGLVTKTARPLSLRRLGAPVDFNEFQWKLQYEACVLSRS